MAGLSAVGCRPSAVGCRLSAVDARASGAALLHRTRGAQDRAAALAGRGTPAQALYGKQLFGSTWLSHDFSRPDQLARLLYSTPHQILTASLHITLQCSIAAPTEPRMFPQPEVLCLSFCGGVMRCFVCDSSQPRPLPPPEPWQQGKRGCQEAGSGDVQLARVPIRLVLQVLVYGTQYVKK